VFLYKFSFDMNDIVVLFYFRSRRNKSIRHSLRLFIHITVDRLRSQVRNEASARCCEKVVFYFTIDFSRYLYSPVGMAHFVAWTL